MALSPKQRQYLKGLAHSLSPVVRVGKGGVSDNVIKETNVSLEAHELIKVRLEAEGAAKHELAEELARATESEIAGVIGKIAILYRRRDDDAKIKLPSQRTKSTPE
jgi:RNA-binding protein